ncbi:MAG TPA: HEAT repeat domain-containing protein [Pyrinomonadaceae bacterium]|nr:HEAT repeat domain-containing protein [Pyrinomonadaceae bacterium]
MNRLILSLTILLACCFTAWPQNRADSSEVLKQLLAEPAPPPRAGETAERPKAPPEGFFKKDNVPPDDTPIDDLIAYWRLRVREKDKVEPSNTVRHRLLDASIDEAEQLAALLPLFPASDEFAEKIKRGFDRLDDDPEIKSQRDEIKRWLVYNSKYFLGELTSLASKVKDSENSDYVEHQSALEALAKLDWSTAEPMLQNLHNGGQQRAAALALTLLYEHSVKEKDDDAAEKFRAQLQAITSNRNLSGYPREIAIEALSVTSWSGQDDWYRSLFNDDSLLLQLEKYSFTPLTYLLNREPDKWLPVLTKLVDNQDRPTQQHAASCLVLYAIDHPWREAILPVLRWLSEPEWLSIGTNYRSAFIQTMSDVDVPESIPGLIWIVENDNGSAARTAARSLARYKDPRAIPALKKALRTGIQDEQQVIIEGLIASGGLTDLEQINALETFAATLTSEAGQAELAKYPFWSVEALPLPLGIGSYLTAQRKVPESLVTAALTRVKRLRTKNEAASKELLAIVHRWEGRQVDIDILKRIADNTAEMPTIVSALRRRESLAETAASELHALLSVDGVPQGIGAILLNSPEKTHFTLTSGNASAQIALLACARLTQTPLPIEHVGRLLQSKNPLLSKAAESYLLAEDSKEAQSLLWRHYPNKAFITGWREFKEFLSVQGLAQLGKVEEKLQAELFKEGGPTEIFALVTTSEERNHVVRIYSDKVVYTYYEDSSRYRERVIPKAEFSAFKEYVIANRLSELGPQLKSCRNKCRISEFLVLSKGAGRRVFSREGIRSWTTVIENFDRLGKGEGARIRYYSEKGIEGLEVLYADESLAVKDVAQQDGEIRIFVERKETDEDRAHNERQRAADETNDVSRAEQRRRQLARYLSRFSWRELKDNDATSITTAPAGYLIYDQTALPFDEEDYSERRDARQVHVLTSETILIARKFKGLWKQVAGAQPVRISNEPGVYAGVVATSDGKWAVISKAPNQWNPPDYIVRFDLETGREFPVKLEPADQIEPLVFLPVHGKVLVSRTKDEYDASGQRIKPKNPPQYYLLDPKTGDVQAVTGEFAPLREHGKRFLQPTGQPGEYWAAIPDEKQTRVGRYNVKDFSFKPVLTVPQIAFASLSMWVDEKEGKLYVVYRDQLLRLPLKSTP